MTPPRTLPWDWHPGTIPDNAVIDATAYVETSFSFLLCRSEVPEGIRLEFLPPYSPELQPAEHLWPLLNEPLANKHFHTLADLGQVLGERCCDLADDHDRISSSTRFHWWPAFI